MTHPNFTQGLLNFIQQSPTPFHAVQNMAAQLQQAGFQRLHEKDSWDISAENNGYYITRNDSSIIAFRHHQPLAEYGIRMLGAHTDSPCLKVKPNPEIRTNNYLQLGVEVYGGALLHPWFDRDLALAGRVHFLAQDGSLQSQLIDWKKAIAIIPSLAIHLDREANNTHSINKQTDLPPVLLRIEPSQSTTPSLQSLLLDFLNTHRPAHNQAKSILDYELSFYDTQPPAITGFNDDFISSARLDNLLSCYIGLMALLDKQSTQNTLLVCNDHEEVGSVSASGAQGNFLKSVLYRLAGNGEDFNRAMASSFMVSMDNAHAIHPNFADKHDANHGPIMNEGPVIKINANQRYASNSESSAMFKRWCQLARVPFQPFVVRSDMGCGSTIGPITANLLGVRTVDVGVPTLAMHSIREMAGCQDMEYLYRVVLQYFQHQSLVWA